jgi:hypothetical protein
VNEPIKVPSAGEPEWQGEITEDKLTQVIGGLLIPNQAFSKAMAREITALRTQVERLSAPVTDAEWVEYCVSNDDGMTWASVRRDDISALLAARKGAAS